MQIDGPSPLKMTDKEIDEWQCRAIFWYEAANEDISNMLSSMRIAKENLEAIAPPQPELAEHDGNVRECIGKVSNELEKAQELINEGLRLCNLHRDAFLNDCSVSDIEDMHR